LIEHRLNHKARREASIAIRYRGDKRKGYASEMRMLSLSARHQTDGGFQAPDGGTNGERHARAAADFRPIGRCASGIRTQA
jgi:hypothetical protein